MNYTRLEQFLLDEVCLKDCGDRMAVYIGQSYAGYVNKSGGTPSLVVAERILPILVREADLKDALFIGKQFYNACKTCAAELELNLQSAMDHLFTGDEPMNTVFTYSVRKWPNLTGYLFVDRLDYFKLVGFLEDAKAALDSVPVFGPLLGRAFYGPEDVLGYLDEARGYGEKICEDVRRALQNIFPDLLKKCGYQIQPDGDGKYKIISTEPSKEQK